MACIRLRSHSIPKPLAGWVLVNQSGIPRFWSTIWADVLRAELEDSTRARHLYAVERLYQSVARQTGTDCLDSLLTNAEFDAIESGLSGFLASLRNDGAYKRIDNISVWASALTFVTDTVRHISASTESRFAEMQARLLRLDRLYAQISTTKPRPPAPIRALPSIVVDDLFRLFDPQSSDNPFRTQSARWRNYLIFLLSITMGLRRGEMAVLPMDAIKSDFDADADDERFWINVEESPYEHDDPRFDAPSIKNTQSRRQLPVSQAIVIANDNLLSGFRGRPNHSYLFGSQKGKPLSLRSVQRIFETVSEHLSPKAKRALADRGKQCVTSHDLRHTCAVYRLTRYVDAGLDLDVATEKLRAFFGWSAASSMPRHYARAYFESDRADIWTENYNVFVDAIRSVEGA